MFRKKPKKGKQRRIAQLSKAQSLDRQSPRYKRWRLRVFKRDNYQCQDCGVPQEELDRALLLLDSNGELTTGGNIANPQMRGIFKYLEEKRFIYVREIDNNRIGGAGLKEMGIVFRAERGFVKQESEKIHQQELEKQRQKWEATQRRRDRRMMLWSALIAAMAGGLVSLIVNVFFQTP